MKKKSKHDQNEGKLAAHFLPLIRTTCLKTPFSEAKGRPFVTTLSEAKGRPMCTKLCQWILPAPQPSSSIEEY